jgi:DNA-binding NarL/FixJ family response regulator
VSDAPRPRAILADDHTLVLEAIAHFLRDVVDVVAQASNGDDLVALVRAHRPDLVITDISMPGRSGIDVCRVLRDHGEKPPMIFLTVHDDPAVIQSGLEAGADGFVVKSAVASELLEAIGTVLAGASWMSPTLRARLDAAADHATRPLLTQRERQVAVLLLEGRSAKQIAVQLGITERTVVFHKQRLRSRFGAANTAQLLGHLIKHDAVD